MKDWKDDEFSEVDEPEYAAFCRWYAENKRGFMHGQYTCEQEAYAAFLEGMRYRTQLASSVAADAPKALKVIGRTLIFRPSAVAEAFHDARVLFGMGGISLAEREQQGEAAIAVLREYIEQLEQEKAQLKAEVATWEEDQSTGRKGTP